ncbi:unnamed protein product [Paramecium sonneborni]|uniref:Uncharacterized protein n=1 Tax=Paramecium sonneborni TaxID=65129 RepID=A0A8S1RT34_9CILI|nr:unnamed protein product [Paramecium sonneborni]
MKNKFMKHQKQYTKFIIQNRLQLIQIQQKSKCLVEKLNNNNKVNNLRFYKKKSSLKRIKQDSTIIKIYETKYGFQIIKDLKIDILIYISNLTRKQELLEYENYFKTQNCYLNYILKNNRNQLNYQRIINSSIKYKGNLNSYSIVLNTFRSQMHQKKKLKILWKLPQLLKMTLYILLNIEKTKFKQTLQQSQKENYYD